MATIPKGQHKPKPQSLSTTVEMDVINVDLKWIKWVIGILCGVLIALYPFIDTKIDALRADNKEDYRHLDAKIDQIRGEIYEIKSEIKTITSLLKDKKGD